MIANAPLALRATLEAVNGGLDRPLAEAPGGEAALFGDARARPSDAREGTRAFLEKRAAAVSRADEAGPPGAPLGAGAPRRRACAPLFNRPVTDGLLRGGARRPRRDGRAASGTSRVFDVPGAFELPARRAGGGALAALRRGGGPRAR